MRSGRSVAFSSAFASASLIATALALGAEVTDTSPRLQYEGITAKTSLADLQSRFPDQVTVEWNAKSPGHRTVRTGDLALAKHALGRVTELSYLKTENEVREIELHFRTYNRTAPNHHIDLSCRELLEPLRRKFGREGSTEHGNNAAILLDYHIWKRGEESMILECGGLPKRRSLVDRLRFECSEACLSSPKSSETPLQYEGISARTTLVDLQFRLPGQVTGVWNAEQPGHRTVNGNILRFVDHAPGRATSLSYHETENEVRTIQLGFGAYNPADPNHNFELSCDELLEPLRRRFGAEQTVDSWFEEAHPYYNHIWKRTDESMILICGNQPKQRMTVDRLKFECRESCISNKERPETPHTTQEK